MALKVSGHGTLVKDFEVRSVRNDEEQVVLKSRIAAFKPRKQDGEDDYFHNLTVFTKRGSRIAKLRKGDVVFINGGTMVAAPYTTRDGDKRTDHCIECRWDEISGPYKNVKVEQTEQDSRRGENSRRDDYRDDRKRDYDDRPRRNDRRDTIGHGSGPVDYDDRPRRDAEPERRRDYDEDRGEPPPRPSRDRGRDDRDDDRRSYDNYDRDRESDGGRSPLPPRP